MISVPGLAIVREPCARESFAIIHAPVGSAPSFSIWPRAGDG